MLLILMYHRVGQGKHSNSPSTLKQHLQYLADHYPIVLPGDPLPKRELSICLSFDDASYDFYHYAFPLLSQLKMRSLLGVPVKYIVESSNVSAEARLSVPYYDAMKGNVFQEKAPFCTWKELREMIGSGNVEVASHSFSHDNVTEENCDLQAELINSKEILEEKLPQNISTFIYPFGKASPKAKKEVQKHYAYSMRIGGALNWGWHNPSKILYRVPADNLQDIKQALKWNNSLKGYLKLAYNSVMNK
ncbi:MAG: peptidoglycan/xylan/chitin deacetylase (PgdA/CDA1 family) [Chlamydiales bacterium]|jgi:peptidoglycan/xylan/chitin deacetylase (PgdA/CDA1 family)